MSKDGLSRMFRHGDTVAFVLCFSALKPPVIAFKWCYAAIKP